MTDILAVNGFQEGECALVNLNEERCTLARLIGEGMANPREESCTIRAATDREHLLDESRQ
jgi:hypothetical protein